MSAEGRGDLAVASSRRNIDDIERCIERATLLARMRLDEWELSPGARIVRCLGDHKHQRALCPLGVGPYKELPSIAASSYPTCAPRCGWDLALSMEDLSQGRPAAWGKIVFVRGPVDESGWRFGSTPTRHS